MIRQNYLDSAIKVNTFYLGLLHQLVGIMQYNFTLTNRDETERMKVHIDKLYGDAINLSGGMIQNKGEYITSFTVVLERLCLKSSGIFIDSSLSKKLSKKLVLSPPVGMRGVLFEKQIELIKQCLSVVGKFNRMWKTTLSKVDRGLSISILPSEIIHSLSDEVDKYLEYLHRLSKLMVVHLQANPNLSKNLCVFLVGVNDKFLLSDDINLIIKGKKSCHFLPVLYDLTYRYMCLKE